ncbi:hypothetical protein [Herbidospora cretacea]|uniref:hypothetical protein n=1 Tax=Herbidospora cretacea TaxID=28444 RepID=UPI00077303EC|nr:hypothetical protein [Herbidospora cretacea]
MDVSDWVTSIIATLALLLAGFTYLNQRRSTKTNERTAEAGERSATASEHARTAAERAAAAAESSARDASTTAKLDTGRWHREMGPEHPGVLDVELRKSTLGDNGWGLFGKITFPRGYRVDAHAAWRSDNRPVIRPLGFPVYLPGPQPFEFFVERFSQDQTRPVVEEVVIHMWPPLDGDQPDLWSCPCGEPASREADLGPHWEMRIPVKFER